MNQLASHQARKRFGQNFLVDLAVIDQILNAIALEPDDCVVEIGPGLSALTAPMLQRLQHLTVVEIDRDLADRLRHAHPPSRLTVVEADALTLNYASFGSEIRLVGNLPYNISSPLLFAFLPFAEHIRDQHFMLQREVIDRMVAKPGTRDYSRLSVMLQSRYRMQKLFDVMPESFDPPPSVVSSVVRMVPLGPDRPQAVDVALFERVVQRAFSQRRKMLRGVMSDWKGMIPWEKLSIAPTARAEELSVADYIAMTDALYEAGIR